MAGHLAAAVGLGHARFVVLVVANQAFDAFQPGWRFHGLARCQVAKDRDRLVDPLGVAAAHDLLEQPGRLLRRPVRHAAGRAVVVVRSHAARVSQLAGQVRDGASRQALEPHPSRVGRGVGASRNFDPVRPTARVDRQQDACRSVGEFAHALPAFAGTTGDVSLRGQSRPSVIELRWRAALRPAPMSNTVACDAAGGRRLLEESEG